MKKNSMEEKKQSKWKQIFYSRWFLLVLFVLVIFLALSYTRAYYQEYKVQQEITNLRNELGSLQGKKLETIELLKYVQTDEFLEDKARTELNLVKPGERMAVIPTDSAGDDSRQDSGKVLEFTKLINPFKWFKLFFLRDIK